MQKILISSEVIRSDISDLASFAMVVLLAHSAGEHIMGWKV